MTGLTRIALVVGAALLLASCGIPGDTQPHSDLGTHAAPLRTAFNAATAPPHLHL
jgi:hypothetical protein